MVHPLKKTGEVVLYWFGYEKPSAASLAPELEGEIPPVAEQAALPEPSGAMFMAAGAFFFSVMSLLVKLAGERLPAQEIVLVRAVFTFVLTLIILRRIGQNPWGNNPRMLIARGLVGFTGLAGFYYAVVTLPLADATVIQYTNPIFAALMAVPLLGERFGWRETVAAIGCAAGVILITEPTFVVAGMGTDLNPLGVAAGLMGAVGSGAAYVLVRKMRDMEHPMVIVFYFAFVSVVLSFPLMLLNVLWPTPREWLILLGIGISTQLGQVSITRGLARMQAIQATTIGYLQIVFAAVWGALFFSSLPDLPTIAGAMLIIGSTLATARK